MSVEDFTQAQLLRRAKGVGGFRTARKGERAARPVKHAYLFRGLIRCTACGRKVEGSPRKHGMYYRCPARTLTPGSPALATQPTICLREEPLRDAVNRWIGELFDRGNIERTVSQLVQSQPAPRVAALVESINETQADRAVAQAEVYAMIDSLGDIGSAPADSTPGKCVCPRPS